MLIFNVDARTLKLIAAQKYFGTGISTSFHIFDTIAMLKFQKKVFIDPPYFALIGHEKREYL